MPTNLTIRRALISVSNKLSLDILAQFLHDEGVEILSTGGTAKAIEQLGIPVTRVEDVTGFPEIMDGRVKTLHPKIHAALLARRDAPDHMAALETYAIQPIELLVVNLYPFEKTVANPDASLDDAIENIDIGGPAMIRAAAKNHESVAVLTDPSQYDSVIDEMRTNANALSLATRRRLGADAFARTAAYDSAITNFMAERTEFNTAPQSPGLQPGREPDAERPLPSRIALPLTKARDLRYGENPHQPAGVYLATSPSNSPPSLATTNPLHGKPLSYNNLLDANAALALARDLASLDPSRHAAVVVKHTNPCGAATAPTVFDAVDAAMAGDPLAAYGGILATTSNIDRSSAERLASRGTFLEVIIARSFDNDALRILTEKSKALRLLAVDPRDRTTEPRASLTIRTIDGGFLVQSRDDQRVPATNWTLAAGDAASTEALSAAEIIWTICKHLSSNAIAIGGPDPQRPDCVRLFGAGAGQMDRVASCRIAVEKAGALSPGAIAASDAFFPFPDGPGILADAGARTIVHPGGSKRDEETFALCRERGIACYTTGVRHFRH